LQNVIERAVILCDGEEFEVDESWLKPESHQRDAPAYTLSGILPEVQCALALRERKR
jgi:DNA-binding NtrC family response regulator